MSRLFFIFLIATFVISTSMANLDLSMVSDMTDKLGLGDTMKELGMDGIMGGDDKEKECSDGEEGGESPKEESPKKESKKKESPKEEEEEDEECDNAEEDGQHEQHEGGEEEDEQDEGGEGDEGGEEPSGGCEE